MRRRTKKGFTLVELVCSLAVAGLAILFGMQLLLVGARAYANGKVLDDNTKKIIAVFETGKIPTELQEKDSERYSSQTLRMTVPGGPALEIPVRLYRFSVEDDRKVTQTELRILEGSLPGNDAS